MYHYKSKKAEILRRRTRRRRRERKIMSTVVVSFNIVKSSKMNRRNSLVRKPAQYRDPLLYSLLTKPSPIPTYYSKFLQKKYIKMENKQYLSVYFLILFFYSQISMLFCIHFKHILVFLT